jgi:hypothetical protein
MNRLLLATSLAAVLALPVASAPAADPIPTPDCHGISITDKQGDSINSLDNANAGSPSSDLIAGWITYDGTSAEKAQANIQVDNLTVGEVDPPYVAVSWELAFSTPAGPRYVRAYEDVSGSVKYNWGEPRAVTDDQTAPRVGGDTTGKLFPGKGGVIQIDMPLKELGATPGSTLKGLALEVRQWASLPAAVPSTGLPLFSPAPIYDTAAGKSYILGPCGATPAPGAPGGPPAPAPSTTTTAPPTAQPAAFDVKVTVPKLSAKKLAKAKKFTIKLKGNATGLTAVVRKGADRAGKALGSGKLATLKGSGKLTLKLKGKLKKGSYVLSVTGKNAQGQTAEGAVKITVKK